MSNEAPPQTDEACYNDSDIAPNAIFEDCIPVKGGCTISRAHARFVISDYSRHRHQQGTAANCRTAKIVFEAFSLLSGLLDPGVGEFVCIHCFSSKLDSCAMSFRIQVT